MDSKGSAKGETQILCYLFYLCIRTQRESKDESLPSSLLFLMLWKTLLVWKDKFISFLLPVVACLCGALMCDAAWCWCLIPFVFACPWMVHGGGGGKRQSSKRPLSCSPLRPVSGRSVGPRGVRAGKLSSGVGNGGQPPSKRGRKSEYHSHEACGPCAVWVALGSEEQYAHHHKRDRSMLHPGDRASEFTARVSTDSLSIPLSPDSCLCKCCYTDCKRATGTPRWVKLHKPPTPEKHCVGCCVGGECSCENCDWLVQDSDVWEKYFVFSGEKRMLSPLAPSHSCAKHHNMIRRITESRVCSVCMESNTRAWSLAGTLTSTHELSDCDWVCDQCIANGSVPELEVRCEHVQGVIDKLSTVGAVYLPQLYDEYTQTLSPDTVQKKLKSFKHYLFRKLDALNCNVYSVGKTRMLLYDERKLSPELAPIVMEGLARNHANKDLSVDHIRSLVKKQIASFPKAASFDYRTLESSAGLMDEYFEPELVDAITTSDSSRRSSDMGTGYKKARSRKICMTIALLCNAMDPRCTFVQLLLGLVAYSSGLQDKGFDYLNSFGCVAGVDLVRQHGSLWAKQRSATDELVNAQLWRASLDNLNFKMKFAKNLTGAELHRMLNLITSQVSFRSGSRALEGVESVGSVPTLKSLAKQSLFATEHVPPVTRANVSIQHYIIESPVFTNTQWVCFDRVDR